MMFSLKISYRAYFVSQVTVNNANLRNHHIYLNSILSMFPLECIGGNNMSSKGNELLITYAYDGKTKSFTTDIAGDKKIFRKRGLTTGTGMLLADLNIKDGDVLQFKKISPYHFEVSKV